MRGWNEMEFSNLLTKFTHSEQEGTKEYFWALQIWEGGVKSAIWTVETGKIKVVALGSRELWQEGLEDLLSATDRSLATASERFIESGPEPSKVIFGLPADWLEEEKISPSRQHLLQALCEKLELAPLGFVLTFDALTHHLKDVEGVPPTAILVNPQKTHLWLAVLEVGQVKITRNVIRSENLADDVYEGLSGLEEVKNLPSRILLFNGEDMEAARQALIDFPWTAKLSFLHFPKVEILPQDFDINALCLAGGSEVARSLGFEVAQQVRSEEVEEKEEASPDFGFVQGEDIKEKKEVEPKEMMEIQVEEEPQEEPMIEKPPRKLPNFAFLREKIAGFSPLHLPGIPLVGLIGGGIFLLLVAGIAFFWFSTRAEVVIYVTPKLLENTFELTVDPNQEVIDEQNLILPGKLVEIEVKGDKSAETSGEKTVGEKARGEVSIFNIGGAKNLAIGTVIAGPGGLKFTLDQVATIASGSALGGAGQAKVGITAADIGADYNLAAGSEFTIANFDKSILAAKNESALTGGTSRQIQAVSEEDQKNLLSRLTGELQEKGRVELLANVSSERLIEESISSKESGRNFNHKVGDEASSLTLSLKVKVKALTLVQDDLLNLVGKQISSSIPQGFEARKEEIKTQLEVKPSKETGSIHLGVAVTANLLPVIDSQMIIQNIKGKTPRSGREILAQLPGFADAEINIKPSLPAGLSRIPMVEKNITIDIKSH